jgi:hypothetical protein
MEKKNGSIATDAWPFEQRQRLVQIPLAQV